MSGMLVPANWLDRSIAWLSPSAGARRIAARRAYAMMTGYDAAEPSRRRKFHRLDRSGDALARLAAMPLRNQARHLDRNHDISHGALNRLTDFWVGPQGINIEPTPKKRDGSIHEVYAEMLARDWAKFCEWPEVTWTHDWGAACRLMCRTTLRDGEALAQLVTGPRNDKPYSMDIPVALELLEPDYLPLNYDDYVLNIRQGIERNAWGRPTAYHIYLRHPGDDFPYAINGTAITSALETKRIPAENMLHPRLTDRLGQLRGVSVFASVTTTLQDIYEYLDHERLAAKMAASWVINFKTGTPEMYGSDQAGALKFDSSKPPIYPMDGGMMVMTAPGQDAEFIDTKRPNINVMPFTGGMLRNASAGFGLSCSSLSRNYDGTYSAQRQELVENQPGHYAGTLLMVAQFARPTYQQFAAFHAIMRATPQLLRELDPDSIADADYYGPPLVWIDPEKEANANLILAQARFRSDAQIIRQLGGRMRETYAQSAHAQSLRQSLNLVSTVDVPAAAVSPAKPSAPDKTAEEGKPSNVLPFRRPEDPKP